MTYRQETPPVEYDPEWFERELSKIRNELTIKDVLRLKKTYVEPTKPRDGDVVYADGTEWDPGSGEGYYGYYGGNWNFLG